MLLNDDISYQDRTRQLKQLVKSGGDHDTINRLFFAARNGAIAYLLGRLEHYFADQDLMVRAAWKETSFGGPTVSLVLRDKRTGEHERRLSCGRDQVHPSSDSRVSTLVYKLKDIQADEYYRGRKPKIAEQFDEILASAEFARLAGEWINGVNYPFTYESHSCF